MTALPPLRAPFTGENPDVALKDALGVIEHAITNHPRSLQRTIGPSEIGTPCDHCLAAKLAGWEQTEDIPWLPTVGTAVHSWLEEAFITFENNTNANHTTGRRYLCEQRTMVGHIGGKEVWGSTDLVDLAAGMTIDWKVVGATTLTSAKRGPTPTYRVQAHLYAKGWNDAGTRIDHVAIAYLPRNAVSLNSAVWWHEPYDRSIAETALERANALHRNLTAIATLGDEARNTWISNLPRHPGCRDCGRYPDRPVADRPRDSVLDIA